MMPKDDDEVLCRGESSLRSFVLCEKVAKIDGFRFRSKMKHA